MKIIDAKYIGSFPNFNSCPESDLPEYAFIGRSNVGKSSLINMLTGRKALAKVSHTPGKTKSINHFLIDEEWYLVDLPGYGYAKVSKKERARWDKMIKDYMQNRSNLATVFVLVDSRITPQSSDIEFMNWMGENSIPFSIVLTKADKPGGKKVLTFIEKMTALLKESWEFIPHMFISSSRNKKGADAILTFIESINNEISSEE